ncbi:MAG: hypothetical protein JW915_17220 [Chitinispirillaceae bacterium]|nr:hypothetical protein [Chitinispirillaceae bacterium]
MRNNKYLRLIKIVIVALTVNTYGAYDPNLRHNDAVTGFLRRMDALQTPFSELTLLPLRYQTVFHYCTSGVDTMKLTLQEIQIRKLLLSYIDPTIGMITWNNEQKDINFRVHLSLTGDINAHVGDGAGATVKGIISPSMTGNLGRISFYSGIDVWTEYNSDVKYRQSSYQPYDGIPYNLYGRKTDSASVRSSDLPRGGINYDAGAVKIQAAIDYLRTGPTVYYPLTLSGVAPPITYLKTDLDLSIIQYSHLAGMLRSQKDKPKYIYFHRLSSFLFKKKLLLGINEVIINGSTTDQYLGDYNMLDPGNYQNRSWELVYLIPFVPFKFVEHYAGDRDNAALSMDMTLWWPERFRWYGELFFDDILAPWKIFSNDWGNKWALTCGMQYFGSIKGMNFESTLEYSHVEPWVYTHFYGGSHQYTHFDKCLGSPLGPNSQGFTAHFQLTVSPKHIAGFGLWYQASNSTVRGGSINDIFQYSDKSDSTAFHDSETKHFLGKGTTSYFGPIVTYSFNPFGRFQIQLRYELDLIEDPGDSRFFCNGGFVF